jgi:transcriptional regulator with XRE-family HTH domain
MTRRRRLAERRKAVGLSQERLAEIVGVDRSTVVRWERADTEPQPWHRPKLADALQVSTEELAQMLADAAEVPRRRDVPVAAAASNSGDDLVAAQSLRVADRQMGGGYLYAAVSSYLQRSVAPRLFGHEADGHGVFTAAAALTEMAGWMAHDAGRDARAAQHLSRAHGLAQVGRDDQLGAHILASLSHLASHGGRADQAINYAQQGLERLGAGGHPGVQAQLLAMRARGHAALADERGCHAALDAADRALTSSAQGDLSPWVTAFDEASLAIEAARCFQRLQQYLATQRRLERVVELRAEDRPRSRAFAQLMLVPILLARGRLDEAVAVAHQVLDGTRHLGSYLVLRQLAQLERLLASHRRNAEAATLLERLREELGQRRWLTQWLPTAGDAVMS